MLKNEKILLTGPPSQVAFPLARELAKENEVYGLARFSRPEDRDRDRPPSRTLPGPMSHSGLPPRKRSKHSPLR